MKGFLVFILILIIIGGLGYIGWSMFYAPMNHQGMNMPPSTTTPPGATTSPGTGNQPNTGMQHGQMPGNQQMPNTQQPAAQNSSPLNITAIQNKDKLNQAIVTINQAIDLITIDPYSKTTVSSVLNGNMQADGSQPSQGTGTINVYPSGNSSVNISPSGNTSSNNATSSTNTNMGSTAGQLNTSYVFDQGKLQQLHNGIYMLAQGIMAINQLNDDLAIQSALVESNPPDYQTYVMRYNTALQNKIKLNNATSLINQANILTNVNPYASAGGYQINVQAMQQLHQGVYKLAQGMTMISRLNDDLTNQMAQAAQLTQNYANMSGMSGLSMHGTGLFGSISIASIFNIILFVMVAGLIIGIFGAIVSLFRKRSGGSGDDPRSDPNAL